MKAIAAATAATTMQAKQLLWEAIVDLVLVVKRIVLLMLKLC